jgi:hypothetical protein
MRIGISKRPVETRIITVECCELVLNGSDSPDFIGSLTDQAKRGRSRWARKSSCCSDALRSSFVMYNPLGWF